MSAPKLVTDHGPAWVPDEIVEGAETWNLKQSLRLLRRGKIEGYADAMMELRKRGPFHEETPAALESIRARFVARAEQKYPELGR